MHTVYFVTNRKANRKKGPDDFGPEFSEESIDDLRFGRATISGTGGSLSVDAIEVAEQRLHADARRRLLGSDALFLDLKAEMNRANDTLVFIHGYNVSFRAALINGAQLIEQYAGAHPLQVVVFSWPSDGSVLPFLAYKSDRTDARASGPALARGLLKLHDFLGKIARGGECKGRVHLMAHSMGNFVLRNGLQELRGQTGSDVPRIFDQIFLMAADEDHDAFEHEHKLSALPELGQAINVYFNRADTALVVSDRTKLNPTRLGARGPRLPLSVPGNVNLIDAGEVVGGVVEHSYFVENEETVKDILAVLGQSPPDLIEGRAYVPAQNRYVLGR